MKVKTIITSLFALIAFGVASAQANAQEVFNKGTQTASVTVGLFGTFSSNITVPPIQLSYEYCVVDNLFNNNNGSIGIGAMGAYFATGYTLGGTKSFTHSGIVGGRGLFHYQFAPKLDTYAGLFLGALLAGVHTSVVGNDASTTVDTGSSVAASFGWGLHLGARYYFTPAFAITGELGYGYSILNLGVTFRF